MAIERLMTATRTAMGGVIAKDPGRALFSHGDDVIGSLAADRADHALGA